MSRTSSLFVWSVAVSLPFLILPVLLPAPGSGHRSIALAEEAQSEEKQAFEAAKELGTVEAWDAFLANYPNGFHADLARAYVKKLGEAAPAAPRTPAAATDADGATRDVTRVWHAAGAFAQTGPLEWIEEDSRGRAAFSFAETYRNSGRIGLRDFSRGVDIILDIGAGSILYAEGVADPQHLYDIVGSSRGPFTVVTKERAPEREVREKPKSSSTSTLRCAKNYKLVKGECVLKQNCGKNAYRSAEGDCYCNKNYMMKNGKCIWKQDKQGFEIAPWKKPVCPSLQKKCAQGNSKACLDYEANCQVN
ncbi:MAG: hypothetical protein NW216_12090 [Hyphomicrobium sp.]|nr:hypothetical protein [Hyphomicrobium sp.]